MIPVVTASELGEAHPESLWFTIEELWGFDWILLVIYLIKFPGMGRHRG